MTTAGWDLQKALVAALQEDAAIMALVNGIYDFVPTMAALPYVRVAVASSRAWGAKTFDGAEHVVRVDTWADAASRETTLSLADLIRTRLDTPPLALSGAALTLLKFEFLEIIPEPDGEVLHGIMRFRALVHPSS